MDSIIRGTSGQRRHDTKESTMTGWMKRVWAGLKTSTIGVMLVMAVMFLGPAPTAQAQAYYFNCYEHQGYTGCYVWPVPSAVTVTYEIWPYGEGFALCYTRSFYPGLGWSPWDYGYYGSSWCNP